MNLRGKIIALSRIATVTVLALTVVFIFSGNKAVAAGNPEISFEGKIVTTAGLNIPDGNYNMEFKIYTGCTNNLGAGCTAVWTEDYLVSGGAGHYATFTSGTFQVNLGSQTAFGGSVPWDTSPLYMSLEMGNTSASCVPTPTFATSGTCGADTVMTPYILLTATPYAEDSAELGGVAAANYAQLGVSQSFTATQTFQPTAVSTALSIVQGGAANGLTISSSANTASNGIVFSGTYATDLISAPNFALTNAGELQLAGDLTSDITTPAVSSGSANGLTIQPGLTSTAISTGGGVTIDAGNESGLTTAVGGTLTLNGGSAIGASGTRSGGNVSIDAGYGGASGNNGGTITIGGTNAASIALGRSGITTTSGGPLVVAANQNFTIDPGSGVFAQTSNITTGDFRTVTDNLFAPAAAATGDGETINVSQLASNTSGNSIVNGLNVAATLSTTGATGTKALDEINANAVTLTGCTGGNCIVSGINVTTQSTGAAATITQDALNVNAVGVSAGTLNGLNISGITGGGGTETAINIGSGWDNQIVGAGFTVGTTGATTITPTTASAVGLTVNGTSGTAATALSIVQGEAANALTISSSANTASNGIVLTGTYATDVISAPHFTVTNAGAVTGVGVDSGAGLLQSALGLTVTGGASSLSGGIASINASSNFDTDINTGTSTGNVHIDDGTGTGTINIGNSAAGAITIASISTIGITIGASSIFGAVTNISTSGTGYGYTIQGGTESGATSIGGSVAINAGTGTTTNGSVTVGTANTASVTLGVTGSATTTTNVNIDNTAGSGAGTDASIISIGGSGIGISNTITGSATTPSDIIQTLVSTPTAFEVIDGNGEADFNVDTTSNTNYLADPDFAASTSTCPGTTGLTNWVTDGTGTPTTLCQNTTGADTYEGHDSLELVTSATVAGQGVKTTDFSPSPTVLQVYTVSFYAMMGSGTMPASQFTVSSTDGATHTCTGTVDGLGTSTLNANGFQEVSCSLPATTGTMTALTIADNVAGVETIYIDDVQLQAGATATAFQLGNLQLRGVINNPVSFQNISNSNTAFQVMNASGTSLLKVDTLDNVVQVGSQVANGNGTFLVLNNYNSYTDPASTCTGANDLGSLYYNTVSDSVRACVDGAWHDLMSTQGMGLLAFGIVENSGTAADAGDYPALISTAIDGPCKVSWASNTQVAIAPCVAYSGGRKVVVPQTTLSLTTTVADPWENVCLSGVGNQPTMVWSATTSTTQTSAGDFPSWSAAAPILCIATIHQSSTTAGQFTGGTAGMIYDTRTYTDTEKVYQNAQVAVGNGYIAEDDTLGVQPSAATLLTANLEGVIVAYSGSTSTTTPDAIMAISGPAEIVSTSGGGIDNGIDYVESSATLGYGLATATAPAKVYESLGFSRTTTATGCTSAATCIGSIFLNLQDSY